MTDTEWIERLQKSMQAVADAANMSRPALVYGAEALTEKANDGDTGWREFADDLTEIVACIDKWRKACDAQ